ncbi:MAG: hypothetical protein HKP58_00580, partial [Desulfatitalea sp.]|nr:hypothetical protein [Desulfatitalea sp.]NNJ98885.1 hypothetical protein [Desulfatitalea sp.]
MKHVFIVVLVIASMLFVVNSCGTNNTDSDDVKPSNEIGDENNDEEDNEPMAITPIAHTDVVPYQRVTHDASFDFGVVAFSKPGIDNVSFAIASGTAMYNGTSPLVSTSMALNTRVASAEYDGVWEYYVTIAASDFSGNGTFIVTPTVTDNEGNTRVLDAVTMIVEGDSAYTHNFAYVNSSTGNDVIGQANTALRFQTIQAAVTAAQAANGEDSS